MTRQKRSRKNRPRKRPKRGGPKCKCDLSDPLQYCVKCVGHPARKIAEHKSKN